MRALAWKRVTLSNAHQFDDCCNQAIEWLVAEASRSDCGPIRDQSLEAADHIARLRDEQLRVALAEKEQEQ